MNMSQSLFCITVPLPLAISLSSLTREIFNTRGSKKDKSGRAMGKIVVHILQFHTTIFESHQGVGVCWPRGPSWFCPSPEAIDNLKQNGAKDTFVLLCTMLEIVTRSPPEVVAE